MSGTQSIFRKKIFTIYDDSISLEESIKLYDDFDLLNKYKVIPLNEIELIDIAAVTMASMTIYSIHGHFLFYFPKFDLIIATHDNIGFILVDVSKGKQKSHYFGLKFLKQAGKIEHFKYYLNETYQEEASTID